MPSMPWSRVRAAQGCTGSAREARPQPLTRRTCASGTSFGFIGFTSPSVGFAVTDAGKLLVSKDGGSHWHAVTI